MSEHIFSPDGKYMWTGYEWIPSPPSSNIENPKPVNEIDQLLDGIFDTEDKQLPQSLSIRDSVVMGDVNQIYNDDEEIRKIIFKGMLDECISRINNSMRNDPNSFFHEIKNIARILKNDSFPSVTSDLINTEVRSRWYFFYQKQNIGSIEESIYGLRRLGFDSWYTRIRKKFEEIDTFTNELKIIQGIGRDLNHEQNMILDWYNTKLKLQRVISAIRSMQSEINLVSSLGLGETKCQLSNLRYTCMQDYFVILHQFSVKNGGLSKLQNHKAIGEEIKEHIKKLEIELNQLGFLRIVCLFLNVPIISFGVLFFWILLSDGVLTDGIMSLLCLGLPVLFIPFVGYQKLSRVSKNIERMQKTMQSAKLKLDFAHYRYDFGSPIYPDGGFSKIEPLRFKTLDK